MKNLFIYLLAFASCLSIVYAQKKNVVYQELPVYGKLFDTPFKYHRIDTAKYKDLPARVKYLYTNSAGLFVTFRSNSSSIHAKWCVTDTKVLSNLTSIAHKGLDVYIKNADGKWQYAGSKGTAKICDEGILVDELEQTDKEFLVYLPLYDETKSLEIGIEEGATFQPLSNPFQKNIAVYGSSIVQGASAGRPGMAYTAILSRRTGLNFINLGVSGSAKMEQEVAHMLAAGTPDVFILDCVPNSLPEIVSERTQYFVEYLRANHPNTPIIMIPSVVRELSYFNQVWNKRNAEQNAQFKKEYETLVAKGIKHLYYLDSNTLLGTDHEGTTDGTHPNDLGFMRMADQIQPFVIEVMQKHNLL
jgi:lysophospholipase L1-like esterase